MSAAADFFARWRVRLGYPLAVLVFWLARPTPRSILAGACVGIAGLWVRAWAAGYLHKQEVLTVTGPYAHTRNPLYLGSAILTLSAAIATRSWLCVFILSGFFSMVYSAVMHREERELRRRHPAGFDEYATAVPLFFPRFTAAQIGGASAGSFSFAQYRKNHEWQAAIGFLVLLALLLLLWHLRLH